MDTFEKTVPPLRSALFVDFDNIFIGLSKSDPLAAERFASDPARWLAYLEKGLPQQQDGQSGLCQRRSILVRRCYPNPDAGFRRFRSYFTSAAFTVIDCPSLTRTGKNSSDIYMVMDILDTLNHKTHFDEFIIFSGDSDFMPVLLRLRAHDRRTTTLAIDFMPPAYKAACDLVISEEDFIEEALGVTQDGYGNGATRTRIPEVLLKEMASRLYEATSNEGEIAGADLPDILKDFREFRDSSNWLGYGTSQRLAEALAGCEPRMQLVRLNPAMYKMVLKPAVEELAAGTVKNLAMMPSPAASTGGIPSGRKEKQEKSLDRQAAQDGGGQTADRAAKSDLQRLRAHVLELVVEMVSGSPAPILLARASQAIVNRLGPQVLETSWAGAGSFKRLLQSAGEMSFEITTQPEPGYLFDPKRHEHPARARAGESEQALHGAHAGENLQQANEQPSEPSGQPEPYEEISETYEEEDLAEEEEAFGEHIPSLEEFIRRVSRVTGAPDLTSLQYAQAFRGIGAELQKIAAGEKSYNLYQSSKAVSEWCGEHGTPISRNDLVLIFKGIIFQDGVRFSKRPGSYSVFDLAGLVLTNIKALCRRSRLELTEYELRLLDEWILCGLEECASEAESVTKGALPE